MELKNVNHKISRMYSNHLIKYKKDKFSHSNEIFEHIYRNL